MTIKSSKDKGLFNRNYIRDILIIDSALVVRKLLRHILQDKVNYKKNHIKIFVGESSLLDLEFSLLFLLPRLPLLPLLPLFYFPK